MTKLEQVARAIADYWREHGFDPSEPSEGAARAAVEAMRYPGEAAVQFGDAVRGNHADYPGGNGTENVFRAMIDAILSEKPDA
jgi:hypothetical protein